MGVTKEQKMKVAINIHPLKSGHKDRGIGFYTNNLIENLRKDQSTEVQEFLDISEVKYADIVHYPWFDFFFHTLPIRKKFKTIITIHDAIPLKFPLNQPVGFKGKVNLILQKIALKNCSNVITDSESSKNDLMKYLRIKEDKISIIHLAANDNFKPQANTKLLYIKRKYNLSNRFFLYVGDANWVKNLKFLVESFYKLINTKGFEDVKLVLVGGVFLKKVENIDHPELESLKAVNKSINSLNLQDVILRPGDLNLDELVSFYNLATAYIQPSLYEGFGLPLVEAFSCGTPVISSNRGSLKEIGGNAALYFNPTNLNQLISLMKEVLNNKSIQEKLSKLSLKRADQFSWNKVAEDTMKVYLDNIKND